MARLAIFFDEPNLGEVDIVRIVEWVQGERELVSVRCYGTDDPRPHAPSPSLPSTWPLMVFRDARAKRTDIPLVVDLVLAGKDGEVDAVVPVWGDTDFAPAIATLRSKTGKAVEVASRGRLPAAILAEYDYHHDMNFIWPSVRRTRR